MVAVKSFQDLEFALLSPDSSVPRRMRAVFALRALADPPAVRALAASLSTDPSALVRHEAAYALGQTRSPLAVPALARSLAVPAEHPMVRHECAEALGAIAAPDCRDILAQFQYDPVREVRETCEIALSRVDDILSGNITPEDPRVLATDTGFSSVDPAPPLDTATCSVADLRATLLNPSLPLYLRYRAMFALRNLKSPAAIDALGDALLLDDTASSPLFRHEAAYVLGQLASERALAKLQAALENERENEMVRHEAAEAIGAVATEEGNDVLRKFLQDKAAVVRESCEVALDISDYWASDERDYADTYP